MCAGSAVFDKSWLCSALIIDTKPPLARLPEVKYHMPCAKPLSYLGCQMPNLLSLVLKNTNMVYYVVLSLGVFDEGR